MDALLLLGPTGVGKTPLGDLLEARGLLGRRCLHFDFGAELRRAAEDPEAAPGVDAEAREVIRRVLEEGRLLEDHEFEIAAALLRRFLEDARATSADWLLLNGLPRHLGQADAVSALHSIRAVLSAWAPPQVIHERIRRNTGGDRAGRRDDSDARIAARLERFRLRTRPLVKHYMRHMVPFCDLEVGVATTALELYEDLARRLPDVLGEPA